MRVLDLFSGIGAMSLGLEWAGMRTVGFCEIDPTCRHWLRGHWPAAPIFEDIRTLSGEAIRERCGAVDLVAGGFPCQDISAAGKGAGLSGARSGLWFEMLRIVREVRPDWVLAENVGALRTRGADEVLEGLDAEGYACWPLVVGADDAGAPQRRKRVWIVGRLADTARDGQPQQPESERADGQRAWSRRDARVLAHANGAEPSAERISGPLDGKRSARGHDADRRSARPVGDAIGEGLALRLGVRGDARAERAATERAGDARGVADSESGGRSTEGDGRECGPRLGCDGARRPSDPTLARGVVARPGERQHEWEAPRLADAGSRRRPRGESELGEIERAPRGERSAQADGPERCSAAGAGRNQRRPESGMGFTASGLARRLARLESARRRARLRALGNCVYPQTVAAIGRAIMSALGLALRDVDPFH